MVRSCDAVLNTLVEHRDAIRSLGVRSLALFGSVATGTASESGDLDFLVEFEHKSFDNYMDLKVLLEDLFDCRVDLVLKNALKPRLREPILAAAVHAPGL